MEKVLQDILKKLDSLEEGQNELKGTVNRIEKRQDFMEDTLSQMEKRQETMEGTLNQVKNRQDAIFEQTAGLVEFQNEVITSLKEIKENQTSLMEMYGKHEVQIRNLKRRTV